GRGRVLCRLRRRQARSGRTPRHEGGEIRPQDPPGHPTQGRPDQHCGSELAPLGRGHRQGTRPPRRALRLLVAPEVYGHGGTILPVGGGTQERGAGPPPPPAGKPFFTPAPRMFPFLVRVEGREFTASLLDVATRKEVRQFEGLRKHPIEEVVFSPDGRRVAFL